MLRNIKKGFKTTNKILNNPVVTQKNLYSQQTDGKPKMKFTNTAGIDIASVMNAGLVKDQTVKKEHSFTVFIEDKDEDRTNPFDLIEKDKKENPDSYAYKTKYPDEKYEDWVKKYEDIYVNQAPPTETYIDDCVELTGFSREEVLRKNSARVPNFVEYDQNGKFKKIKWEAVKQEFKLDPRANSMIDSIESSHNLLEHRMENYEDVVSNLQLVDWQQKERELGEETVLALRERWRETVKRSLDNKSMEAAKRNVSMVLDPAADMAKDDMIDNFPMFKKVSQGLKSLDRQLEIDEDGLPVWDFTSTEFIDTFYPEIRDEILVEIDHFDVDMEYKAQFKQLSHQNTDDLSAFLSDEYWYTVVADKVSNEFFAGYEDTSETKRNLLVSKGKKELDEKIAQNQSLSQAVTKLKSQLEYVDDVKDDKKKEKHDLEKSNQILHSIGINPDGKMVIVKDWKHKPHETIEDDTISEEEKK